LRWRWRRLERAWGCCLRLLNILGRGSGLRLRCILGRTSDLLLGRILDRACHLLLGRVLWRILLGPNGRLLRGVLRRAGTLLRGKVLWRARNLLLRGRLGSAGWLSRRRDTETGAACFGQRDREIVWTHPPDLDQPLAFELHQGILEVLVAHSCEVLPQVPDELLPGYRGPPPTGGSVDED
jgi:hypothetical protein